ncbi:MFS general substrate transporter [Aspergillus sclerotioniger CBS 115572]|uniref:MFS general substrate transporter n=1 Tax=Aspergillus sclerotioniger CBS 115572 TaxID=1450535 RepID=A0A317W0W1_9EURO|nr:MFS general substrate transporter [Aspergillus sclerotioniger CBS 115572]PWY79529.1 MFS general substrate transporter [Aspergillus sclerotioniger CBS 115572]
MEGLIHSSTAGQLLRWITRNKVLPYPEEQPDFQCPHCYADGAVSPTLFTHEADSEKPESDADADDEGEAATENASRAEELSRVPSMADVEKVRSQSDMARLYSAATQTEALQTAPSRPIAPTKTADGTILVDWYTTHDPENPQNWSSGKKLITVAQIYLYTLVVYMGSSIYTPSAPQIQARFGVSETAASLGLALYVLGYGVGPMLFSPLSEIPSVGRNPPYIITFALFIVFSIGAAVVNTFGGLLVLRFLQGFFGSPCLATGGASIGDVYSLLKLPYGLTTWAAFATLGPALGPVISGFSVPVEGWRWSLWETVWMSSPILVVMFFFLPETFPDAILLRRAQRLRRVTGNNKLLSQSEINQKQLTVTAVAMEALYRPFQIVVLDPAILFVNVYTSLIYGIYYSFFEVFPSIAVALAIAVPLYFLYLNKVFEPEIRTQGLMSPERRLIPALFACFLPPIGLFLFGWTSRPSVYWIVSVVGILIYTIGIFMVIQCIFIYIPMTYPQYAASLFAGNDLMRSALACGAVLFARPLYVNLGVGPGISLLAGLTVGCIAGMFALYYYGAALRARSRFTAK